MLDSVTTRPAAASPNRSAIRTIKMSLMVCSKLHFKTVGRLLFWRLQNARIVDDRVNPTAFTARLFSHHADARQIAQIKLKNIHLTLKVWLPHPRQSRWTDTPVQHQRPPNQGAVRLQSRS